MLSQTASAFETARKNMVLGQLIPNRISSFEILEAMGTVPREKFLPSRLQGRAYADEVILLQNGCFLFEPLVLARLLQLANIKKTDFVLDLRSGSGYSAALMAYMSQAVVAVENDSGLCDAAQKHFIDMEIDNVAVLHQNPDDGFPSQAPFDVIFVEGIVSQVSETLVSQLSNGGSLVCVTMKPELSAGKAVKVTKNRGILSYSASFDVGLDELIVSQMYKNFDFDAVS